MLSVSLFLYYLSSFNTPYICSFCRHTTLHGVPMQCRQNFGTNGGIFSRTTREPEQFNVGEFVGFELQSVFGQSRGISVSYTKPNFQQQQQQQQKHTVGNIKFGHSHIPANNKLINGYIALGHQHTDGIRELNVKPSSKCGFGQVETCNSTLNSISVS